MARFRIARITEASKHVGPRVLAGAGLVATTASGVFHSNGWHLVAAMILATSLMLLIALRDLDESLDGSWIRARWAPTIGHVAVLVVVCGLFLPAATLALRGVSTWAMVGLAGSLWLIWITAYALLPTWRHALGALVWVAAIWVSFYASAPLVGGSHPVIIGLWLVAAVLATVLIIESEAGELSRPLARVSAVAFGGGLGAMHIAEYIDHVLFM